MLNNIENWRPFPLNPDYEVSDMGNIRNKENKVMKPFINNAGYVCIKLACKHFLVHRVVALTWIDNPKQLKYVNHINGSKFDNRVTNLEWVTNSENILHARRTGLNPYNNPTANLKLTGKKQSKSKYFGVYWDNNRRKWIAYVVYKKVKYLYKRFNTELEAARARDKCIVENDLQDFYTLNNV